MSTCHPCWARSAEECCQSCHSDTDRWGQSARCRRPTPVARSPGGGLRYFDVIAKDRIELHLERRNSGALTFAVLDLRQHCFAVARQLPKFVQFAIEPGRNHSAIGEA